MLVFDHLRSTSRRFRSNIAITTSVATPDKRQIQEIADRVAEHIRQGGGNVYFVYVPEQGQHPAYSQVLGVLRIIGALGFLSLFLAGFLIFNTFSALMVQHVRYIGIMKAIGARPAQVVGMYLVLIIVFSLLALLPAIPISAYLAWMVAVAMGKQFNYDSLGFRLFPAALLVQVAVGLGVPLLAGFLPVVTGARITIHDALSTYGLGKGHFGRSLIDRMVENTRGLSCPLLISLRNTVRRKGRLVLTLTTLALGGAIGLMGTTSMNVLERTREVGVMRAIGASNAAVFRIVLVEGMLIGFISLALGALLALPITGVLYDILSRALFQAEGKAVVTQDGFIIWLVVAIILSAIASLVPAQGAARMTVRDVLAYE